MRVVVALGGNALARRGEPVDGDHQRRNVAAAAKGLADIATEHALVVTHGNGPQIGMLALRSRALPGAAPPPLDVLGAESAGMIGYALEQGLRNLLPGRECATLLTQVIVSEQDPAFRHPTKPIGPRYTIEEAVRLGHDLGWQFADEDGGRRRVVASPWPLELVERDTIVLLVDAGVIVVCAGGGGIPVVVDAGVGLRGVEAVIDKDRSAALLARATGADALLLLTDAEGVYVNWGTPEAKLVRRAHPDALRRLTFDAGSMGPKVQAAVDFAASGTGRPATRWAAIGAMEDAAAVLRGERGTTITVRTEGMELIPPDWSGAP